MNSLLMLCILCTTAHVSGSTLPLKSFSPAGTGEVFKSIGAGREARGLFSTVTVKVANTMGPNEIVWASAASGDDNIGRHTLRDGQQLQFSFRPKGNTLFWCDVETSSGKKSHWDIYKGYSDSGSIGWFLRGDGIYRGTLDGNNLRKTHTW